MMQANSVWADHTLQFEDEITPSFRINMVQYVDGGHNVESGGGIRYFVSLHYASLSYLTPNEFVARTATPASRQATGRDAAVHGASAPRPVAQPSRRGQMQPAREAVSS